MRRRALLAAPLLAAPVIAAPGLAAAQVPAPSLVTEEYLVPSGDLGIDLFLRSKRQPGQGGAPGRTVLFIHGADSPASTSFDLPLGGLSWMDYMAGRGFDTWLLDLRGFGRSGRPAAMAQPPEANPPIGRAEQAVADLGKAVAFIRQQRQLQKLCVMGHALGTTLAAGFAAANPTLVERLVLVAPAWLSPPSAVGAARAGAWRGLTVPDARATVFTGVPAGKQPALVPPGWFEHWSGVTWALDPDGMRQNPPILRLPTGLLADWQEHWAKGQPTYDPEAITAPTLLVAMEWSEVLSPEMALALFGKLTVATGRRLVVLAEGTQELWRERNRGALFQAVQVFLEEQAG